MAGSRNRKLKYCLESLGITVNIGKNKARGNKGFFKYNTNGFRVDISENLTQDEISRVLVHEFAHYIHYKYDKSLKSLNFIFGEINEQLKEELINVTVNAVPKDFAQSIFNEKEKIRLCIKTLSSSIKSACPGFKLSEKCSVIEKTLKPPLRYLLKYDRIKAANKIYSIDDIEANSDLSKLQTDYIILKSKQRAAARINSKISRLNGYYNNPSELFARFAELYFLEKEKALKLAPHAVNKTDEAVAAGKIPELKMLDEVLR